MKTEKVKTQEQPIFPEFEGVLMEAGSVKKEKDKNMPLPKTLALTAEQIKKILEEPDCPMGCADASCIHKHRHD